MMRLGRLLAVFCAVSMLSGCAHESKYFQPAQSNDRSDMSSAAAKIVATDVVASMKSLVGLPNATVNLVLDDRNFGVALREAMSKAGYRIGNDGAVTAMSYSVVNNDGQALVRVTTSSVEFARAYAITATGVEPVSPVSLMHRSGA